MNEIKSTTLKSGAKYIQVEMIKRWIRLNCKRRVNNFSCFGMLDFSFSNRNSGINYFYYFCVASFNGLTSYLMP